MLGGLIALTIVYTLGRKGHFASGSSYWGAERAVNYWPDSAFAVGIANKEWYENVQQQSA